MFVEGNTLIEIKASCLSECSNEWIIQTLMYCYLLQLKDIKIDKFLIANVFIGKVWTWNLSQDIGTFEEIIKNKLGPHYEWHDLEIKALLDKIN